MSEGGGVLVCRQLAAPIGRSPFAALPLDPFPLEAVVPIGLSPPCVLPLPPCPIFPSLFPFPFPWPFPPQAVVPLTTLCPSSSSLPNLPSLLSFPFPWSVVPTEPPDFPCLTALCRVHTEEGNRPRRWPGASKRSSRTGVEGSLPNGGFWALGCPLAGSFTLQWHITTFCLSISCPFLRSVLLVASASSAP